MKKWKIFRLFVLSIAIAVLVLFLSGHIGEFSSSPFEKERAFNFPVYAAIGVSNDLFVIDNAFRRISRVSPSGGLLYTIDGGSREKDRFFYANEIAPGDDSSLYVLNYVLDQRGFFMDSEQIIRYRKDGSFDSVLYRKDYPAKERDTTLIQRGRIDSMSVDGNLLYWFEADREGMRLYRLDTERKMRPDTVINYPLQMANILVSGMERVSDREFIYTTKRGKIFRVLDGIPKEIYSWDDRLNAGVMSSPWDCDVDRNGNVYFMDLAKREIRSIGAGGAVETAFSRDMLDRNSIRPGMFDYYRMSVTPDGRVVTCNDEAVLSIDPATKKTSFYYRSVSYSPAGRVIRFVLWAIPAIILFLLVLLARYFYVDVMDKKAPRLFLAGAGVVLVTAVVAVAVTAIVFGNFSKRYKRSMEEKISQMVQVIPRVIDVNRLEKLTNQSEYMGPDYRHIRSQLHGVFNQYRDAWNTGYEFVVYRLIEGRLYGFLYENDQVGMAYPFNWLEDTNSAHSLALKGRITTAVTSDRTGDWIYGVGPVTNRKGKTVALFETGTDVYAFEQENRRLLVEVIVEIATFLAILVLLMIELVYLRHMLDRKKLREGIAGLQRADSFSKKTLRENRYSEAFLARPLMFLFSSAISVSVAFIPLLMKSLYRPLGGLPENIVLALPISVEVFLFGLSTIPAGALASRKGWRTVFFAGLALTGAGLVASALAHDMFLFLAARALTGIGGGFAYMSIRSFINREPKEEYRDRAYSNFYSGMIAGLNVGMVFGAVLADKAGYPAAFFAAFGIIVITAVFQLVFYRQTPMEKKVRASVANRPEISVTLKRLFGDRQVVVFFLLIMVPVYLAGAFLSYYFPLFAETKGLGNDDTGRLLLMNGLAVIYLGPVLSAFFERKFGNKRTLVVVMFSWAASLAIFAFTGSIAGAAVALILMGLTQGVGVVADDKHFLGLRAVKKLGHDRATGYFEFLNKVGETAGPMLFAAVLLIGSVTGVWVIAGAILVSGVAYWFVSAGEIKKKQG